MRWMNWNYLIFLQLFRKRPSWELESRPRSNRHSGTGETSINNVMIKLINHNCRIYNRSFLKHSLLQFLADLRRSAGGDGQRSPELDLTRSNIDLYSYMKYITIVFIYLPDPFISYTLSHIHIRPGLALSSGSRQGKGRLARRLTPGTNQKKQTNTRGQSHRT